MRTRDKVVALTFDDGPDPRFTPQVLAVLERFHAHATFFVVGRNVEQHPELAQAEIAAGDQVENHTYDHPDLDRLAAAQVDDELNRGAAAIRAAGLPDPTMFRPPKGLTDDIVGVVADVHGYRTIFWDISVERYVNHAAVRPAVDAIMERIRPGDIILAHDGRLDRSRTLVALPYLLERLRARGYRVVTVSQLMHHGSAANVAT